jgi:hypothetical protein
MLALSLAPVPESCLTFFARRLAGDHADGATEFPVLNPGADFRLAVSDRPGSIHML